MPGKTEWEASGLAAERRYPRLRCGELRGARVTRVGLGDCEVGGARQRGLDERVRPLVVVAALVRGKGAVEVGLEGDHPVDSVPDGTCT